MLFDARAAKSLKPGEALAIQGCPGLRLLASETRKTWTYRYKTPEGKLRQIALGPFPTLSFQDAFLKWTELRDARKLGDDPAKAVKARRQAKATPAPEIYTVEALVQDYIRGHLLLSRKAAGAEAAKRALERVMAEEPEFAARAAATVDRGMCFEVLDRRKDAPTAAAKLRSMFGSAWDYALDAGRLDGSVPNWWRQVMKGRLKSKGKVMAGEHIGQRRRALNSQELGELIRWLPAMHQLGADGVTMYLWTCTRGSEIFGMRPEHVRKEADGAWWTIPKAETKNARNALAVDLRVPLCGRALDIVQRRMESIGESGFLFEDTKGKAYRQHDFSTYIYDLQPYSPKSQRRGETPNPMPVTDWTPHNLRRSSRTMLAALGCPKEVAEAIVGHMPELIEATYNVHTYDAERRDWLQRLSDHLEALAALPALP